MLGRLRLLVPGMCLNALSPKVLRWEVATIGSALQDKASVAAFTVEVVRDSSRLEPSEESSGHAAAARDSPSKHLAERIAHSREAQGQAETGDFRRPSRIAGDFRGCALREFVFAS